MLNRVNGKLIKIMGILLGLFLLVIVIVMIFGGNKVLSYDKIENRMIAAAKKYYKDNEELLPRENGDKTSVSGLELESGYMPNISKMVEEGIVCNGEVRVYKFNDEINYVPYLNCGDEYVTSEFFKEVTKDSNIAVTSSGLYKIGNEYVFRGMDVNNYVMFSDKLWRIMSIDEDGNVKLIQNETKAKSIWDNSYNIEKKGAFGINLFYNEKTEPSKMYKYLQEIVQTEEFLTKEAMSKLSYVDICYASRSQNDESKNGATECALKVSSPVGIISVHEYLRVSLDENCKSVLSPACSNYNYLSDFTGSIWTSTPVTGSSYEVYKISGSVSDSKASSSNTVRAVINLNSSAIYASGDGTLNSPYQIK